jgi:acyl-coenzyme A thioesterase PaaI-like protein
VKPERLEPSEKCFGCGPKNPIGLALKVERDGQACVARFLPNQNHEGWRGMVHGGVLATLLDEIMGWALWYQEVRALTGSLSVRFCQPAPLGEEILLRGWLDQRRGRRVETRGEARSSTGAMIAEAKALCVVPPDQRRSAEQ